MFYLLNPKRYPQDEIIFYQLLFHLILHLDYNPLLQNHSRHYKIVQLTHNLDEGDIYGKCELSLMGDSMSEIFKNLEFKTVSLVNKFFDAYPNVEIRKQKKIDLKTLNRRKASDSKIDFEDFNEENLLNLYNKIRCLTDPYPNAFIEDKKGNKLFFESIKFEKKD